MSCMPSDDDDGDPPARCLYVTGYEDCNCTSWVEGELLITHCDRCEQCSSCQHPDGSGYCVFEDGHKTSCRTACN